MHIKGGGEGGKERLFARQIFLAMDVSGGNWIGSDWIRLVGEARCLGGGGGGRGQGGLGKGFWKEKKGTYGVPIIGVFGRVRIGGFFGTGG